MVQHRSLTTSTLQNLKGGVCSPELTSSSSRVHSVLKGELPYVRMWSVQIAGFRKFRTLTPSYTVLSDFNFPDLSCFPRSATGCVRELTRKEEVFKAGNYIYLFSEPAASSSQPRLFKFNLVNQTYEILLEDSGLFIDGVYYDGYLYLGRTAPFANDKILKISPDTLSVVARAGAGREINNTQILIIPELNQILVLDYRYSPYWVRIQRFHLLTFAFISTVSNIVDGSPYRHQKGFVRVGEDIFFVTRTSTTGDLGNGRLVKIKLPDLNVVGNIIVSSGRGVGLSVDKSGNIGYVVSGTHLYKYNLNDLSLITSVAFPGLVDVTATGFLLDEERGVVIISGDIIYDVERLLVYRTDDLSLIHNAANFPNSPSLFLA